MRRFYVLLIALAAAALLGVGYGPGGSGPGSSGGPRIDADNNQKYESAFLWDADGDGSTYVTCTAKDTPDPACKADGEIIYRDVTDDMMCAIHGGCGSAYMMEPNGVLRLRSGVVYVQWPCWDAREPAGFNDPTATDDNLHDAVADTAWSHCAPSPDPGSDRRFHTINFLGWQGTVEGGGSDTRNPATTTGYKRDTGTYLVDDRGPTWQSGANANLNNWFGQQNQVRGIGFGFTNGIGGTSTSNYASTESLADGDSKGYTIVSGTQTIAAMNGSLCVADDIAQGALTDNWAQGLVAGDVIVVAGTTETNTLATPTLIAAIRVRDVPTGATCNGAGTTAIPLGGRLTSGTSTTYAADLPILTQVTNGFVVIHMRSDARNARTTLRNLTIEPQDWWDEPSGDCSGTGVFSLASDGALSDFDCDTQNFIGIWGGGASVVEDVVLRNWHSFAIDGNSNIGDPLIRRVRWMYGHGDAIMDFGSGWNIEDVEVHESQFAGAISAAYGPGVRWSGLKVYNSAFNNVISFRDHSIYNVYENFQVYSSSFMNLFTYDCGTRYNFIRNVQVSGYYTTGGVQVNGSVARMLCSTTTEPILGNTLMDVRVQGIGPATVGTSASHALVVLDSSTTAAADNTDAIRDNRFEGLLLEVDDAAATTEACIFGAVDREATTSRDTSANWNHENVLGKNIFYGNTVRNTGAGSADVYCGCGVFDAAGNSDLGHCDKAVRGIAGGGTTDPRGAANFENNAASPFDAF